MSPEMAKVWQTCGDSVPRSGLKPSSKNALTRLIALTLTVIWKNHGWATSGTACVIALSCTTT